MGNKKYYSFITGLFILTLISIWLPSPSKKEIFKHRMELKISNFHGDAGVYIKDLYNGNGYVHEEKEVFPSASCIKLPVLAELYLQSSEG